MNIQISNPLEKLENCTTSTLLPGNIYLEQWSLSPTVRQRLPNYNSPHHSLLSHIVPASLVINLPGSCRM